MPVNDPIYDQAYGVRSLYELLDEAIRYEGGIHVAVQPGDGLAPADGPVPADPRRLVHPDLVFPRRTAGCCSAPAMPTAPIPSPVPCTSWNIGSRSAMPRSTHVLRKLLRGRCRWSGDGPKTFVEGPVDYTDLRTEFIGLIYEGLLDYRLKRTDEQTRPAGLPQPRSRAGAAAGRLEDMLANDRKGLKDLLTTLRKEKVTASVVGRRRGRTKRPRKTSRTTSRRRSSRRRPWRRGRAGRTRKGHAPATTSTPWRRPSVGPGKPSSWPGWSASRGRGKPTASTRTGIEAEATRLIKRVAALGEFYLVRAGNTRKGTGTFYTRPQLAVPTVHRTLEPLCYDKADGRHAHARRRPKTSWAQGLRSGLRQCLVPGGGLHYLTDALYKSLCHHRKLDDPARSNALTLPYGRPRTASDGEELRAVPAR